MLSASKIRQTFLDYFKSKGHIIVPSAPIVVKNDPTLLFTNAGMNQFKDYFLGDKQATDTRVADTQKCLRVSGKHNDLEEVGVDTYHHTMFEMLGNWSFGDYFKKEAIEWAWDLLTEVYGIDKDRLYVTVFEGDDTEGLSLDEEAQAEWRKWIAEDRILMGDKKDNFWEMGATGPCGPCSEIHIDMRSEEERQAVDGKTLVNQDHPQVIEIWNLVFMQFNRKKDGQLVELPAKHVDTGMGLERLVRVLQGKSSNYDTDLFTNTFAKIEALTGRSYDFGHSQEAVAFRVIADHIRAICFAIADGQLPSNTGAGYVIRRILRRAVRYFYSALAYKQPLLFQLVPLLAQQFEEVFPELKKQEAFIARVIKEEELSFLHTLEAGLSRINLLIEAANKVKHGQLGGGAVFELYDTFGFPVDLTRLIASEQQLEIDEQGFEAEMQKQKNRSRKATTIDTDDWVTILDGGKSRFAGYEDLLIPTRVVKYRRIKEKNKTFFQIVLEETPFYGEMGGQVGDKGQLVFGDQALRVLDTKHENDLIVHLTNELADDMSLPVLAKVNPEVRLLTTYNHTATHLLHAALKQVLGPHVNQKGSLVSPEILRFDFSHFAKLTDEELEQVTDMVNKKIRENIPVIIKEMPKEEALQLGAMALFGEKYDEVVRVVTVDPDFSIELCGGTHVGHTGMIGLFIITSETSVSAGVRRVEALTGPTAVHYLMDLLSEHKSVAGLLKTKNPLKSIEKLINDKAEMEKRLEALESKERSRQVKDLKQVANSYNGIQFVSQQIHLEQAGDLKKILFDLMKQSDRMVAVLTADINGKANVGLMITDDLVAEKSWDASQIIKKEIAPLIQGGGGGQKNLATAGGQQISALDKVRALVRNLLEA